MGEALNFIDTTTRDGSQSNWAAGMPVGMMDAVLEDIDKVGYDSMDCPLMPLQFKKIVRDLKEDPWEMVRMFGKKAPNTVKGCLLGPGLRVFDMGGNNWEAVQLFMRMLVDMGALQKVMLVGNMVTTKDSVPGFIELIKKLGLKTSYAVCYYVGSPLHTLEFYANKTQVAVALGVDSIYLKDAGGLLTVDTVRSVLGVMKENANGIPLEIHGHCTTGLMDAVYAEAYKLGCRGFHVTSPPLAEGTAQPSVFNTAENMKALGGRVDLDLERAARVAKKLTAMAREAGLPEFGPTRYSVSQYIHRVPGGVISNLKHQLRELHLQDRLDEVIDECIRICAEMGEPHMITPYSQYVCTQAAINVAMGERYKVVIDDFIRYAMGLSGPESGYLQMDPALRDRFANLPRAAEIKEQLKKVAQEREMPLRELRNQYGAHLSDEEFLLRYMMKTGDEIAAMREATKEHPFQRFSCMDTPILELIKDLGKQPKITQVHVRREDKVLVLKRRGDE